MKKCFPILLLALPFLMLPFACTKEYIGDDPNNVGNENMGTIKGTVHAPNDNQPIGGALVFIDDAGEIYYTYSEANGEFELLAPEGHHTLYIQTGDGSLFNTSIQVDIIAGQVVLMPKADTELRLIGNMAFIAGIYDKIEAIVDDTLGYPITEITSADLLDLSLLNTYDAIFMNCDAAEVLDTNAYINLAQFVTDGGSIYVSDFAVAYLIGDYTGFCTRPGGFIDDDKLCTLKYGPVTLLTGANIVAGDFQAAMGTSSMDIEYDLGGWEVVQDMDTSFWEVIVDHPTYGALMLRNTTFSNGNGGGGNGGGRWITICHNPGGGGNPITITININAWPAHQAHGDTMGPCEGSENGGKIYYTTFHNEPNGSIGQDMANMLEYVILSL